MIDVGYELQARTSEGHELQARASGGVTSFRQ